MNRLIAPIDLVWSPMCTIDISKQKANKHAVEIEVDKTQNLYKNKYL